MKYRGLSRYARVLRRLFAVPLLTIFIMGLAAATVDSGAAERPAVTLKSR